MQIVERTYRETDIAVIGLAGRFPGADDVQQFWELLLAGYDGIERGANPDADHVHAVGRMRDAYQFDAAFFDIPESDALQMDPQHRLVMETVWEALEHAGYAGSGGDRSIGLFIGADDTFYVWNHFYNKMLRGESVDRIGQFLVNAMATRISYRFNLQGPAVVMRASCATSLATVHYAIQSLLNGDCNLAVAGGVNVKWLPDGYPVVSGMTSAQGVLRAYDANGDGFVPGDGVGMVVLKRLDDALADGDHIEAVITGSALVNDGNRKAGYHASGVAGEAEAIYRAMRMAGRVPQDLFAIEGHGTATPLGDAVELRAVDAACRRLGGDHCKIAIGSVKANIGHLNTAAGAAGLIKAILSVRHRMMPPAVHFETANPELSKTAGRLFVPTRPYACPDGQLAVMGVSSFGFGGIDAHMIVEQPPERIDTPDGRDPVFLPVSARTASALARNLNALKTFLMQPAAGLSLYDAAWTLWNGRTHWQHRAGLLVRRAGEGMRISEIRDGASEADWQDMAADRYQAVANAWLSGRETDWQSLFEKPGRRMALPTYGFDRRHYRVADMTLKIPERHVAIIDGLSASRFELTRYLSRDPLYNVTVLVPGDQIDAAGGACALGAYDKAVQRRLSDEQTALLAQYQLHLIHQYPDWQRQLSELTLQLLCRYLSRSALLRRTGLAGVEALRHELGILPEHRDFLMFILSLFARAGYWTIRENALEIKRPLPDAEQAVSESEAALARFKQTVPWDSGVLELLVHCIDHYDAVFTGRMPGNAVLYPGGSYAFLRRIDRSGSAECCYCRLAAVWIESMLKTGGRPVRILEIGGGTGELTDELIPLLSDDRIEYWFTDIGPSFLADYRRKQGGQVPENLHFKVLDITKPFAGQGFGDQSFDLVIGANVMQATADMQAVMQHIRAALKPGGWICMVQLYRIEALQQLIFGLSPGWWNYLSDPYGRETPYFDLPEWHRFYSACGFASVGSFPALQDAPLSNAAVLFAQKPGAAAQPTDNQPDLRLLPEPEARRRQLLQSGCRFEIRSMPHPEQLAVLRRNGFEIIGGCADEAAAEAAPGDPDLRTAVAGMLCDILNLDSIGEDFIAAFDSLSLLILSARLKSVYAVEIRPAELYQMASLNDLLTYIRRHRGTAANMAADPAAGDRPFEPGALNIQDLIEDCADT